jgi:hypothetical protein
MTSGDSAVLRISRIALGAEVDAREEYRNESGMGVGFMGASV